MIEAVQIKYREGCKYQLTEPVLFRVPIYPPAWISTDDGSVTLSPSGDLSFKGTYAWDGPSGPTLDTKGAMPGSLGHDGLYQLIRQGKLDPKWKEVADKWYEERVRFDSGVRIRRDFPKVQAILVPITSARASAHFGALRRFGSGSTKADAEPPVLTAP